jgi:flagellar basal body-associated protein FliL
MDHTTSINVFLIVIVVLFIGGLVIIGRKSGKSDNDTPDQSNGNPRGPF